MRIVLLAVAAVLALPGVAAAEVPEPLRAVWITTGAHEAEREAAVTAAANEMGWLARGIAKKRLRRATEPCGELQIWETPEGHAAVRCDDAPPAIAPVDGSVVRYTTAQGDSYDLSYRRQGNRLIQTFADTDGARTVEYWVEGGKLRLKTTLSSDRLTRDVVYGESFVVA